MWPLAQSYDDGEASGWRTSAVVWVGDEWAPTVRHAQNMLRLIEYLSGFQARHVQGIGQG